MPTSLEDQLAEAREAFRLHQSEANAQRCEQLAAQLGLIAAEPKPDPGFTPEQVQAMVRDACDMEQCARSARDLLPIYARDCACHIKALASELEAILEMPHINKRKCHDCGNVAWHEDNVTPYVNCRKCGSQDTRLIREIKP